MSKGIIIYMLYMPSILYILYQASDFDDDAMFRLDDMLSAAFKSLRKGKRLDKEKELKLKHYKMRFIIVVFYDGCYLMSVL